MTGSIHRRLEQAELLIHFQGRLTLLVEPELSVEFPQLPRGHELAHGEGPVTLGAACALAFLAALPQLCSP